MPRQSILVSGGAKPLERDTRCKQNCAGGVAKQAQGRDCHDSQSIAFARAQQYARASSTSPTGPAAHRGTRREVYGEIG